MSASGKFNLTSAENFPDMPDMEWLIENVLPSKGLASIFGPSGVGKSFICLDLGAAVASGMDWFGHQTKQSPVVYVALEGQAGIRRRVAAWAKHREAAYPNNVKFVFDSLALNKEEDTHSLAGIINVHNPEGTGLIIIDTLNRAAPGADENSSAEMGRLIAGASALQSITDCLVLLVHHPGKDGSRGLRGHSSLYAALDAVVEVNRDGQRWQWNVLKSKDGQDDYGHAFELAVVELGINSSGRPISSCAIVEIEGSVRYQKQNEPRGGNQKAILAGFKELLLQAQMLSAATGEEWPAGILMDDAVSQLKDRLETVDQKHRQIRTKEALERLVQMGYLTISNGLLVISQEHGGKV